MKLYVLLVLIALVSGLVGYQNGAKVKSDQTRDLASIGDDIGEEDDDGGPGEEDDNDHPDEYYIAQCNAIKKFPKLQMVPADSSLVHFRGSISLASKHLVKIEDARGAIRIIGLGENATIDLISDVRGKLIICNMDIAEIVSKRGNLTVINGNVGSIEDFRGNLRIINGTVNQITNSRGNIR